MAFINELMPEDRKNSLSFPVSVKRDGARPTLWKWTVDKERGVFLVMTGAEGGGYEGTELIKKYALSFLEGNVYISAKLGPVVDVGAGPVMNWTIIDVKFDSSFLGSRDEILPIIVEAFSALGDAYNGDKYAAVNVQFRVASIFSGCE